MKGLAREKIVEALKGEVNAGTAKAVETMAGTMEKPLLARAAQALSGQKVTEETIVPGKSQPKEENGSRKLFLNSVNEINLARQQTEAKQLQEDVPVKSSVERAISLAELPQKVSRLIERLLERPKEWGQPNGAAS